MTHSVPLFGVYKDAAAEALALEVMRSGQIAAGRYVGLFAQAFGELVSQQHVVTVNDMSNAIQIALRLAGVEQGDEVLTTSYACMSTNAPIATSGARPVWVEVDPQTGLMDPDALERAITPRAKAVLVYHLAGYPADVARIADICRARGLQLIEDCDNALLATMNGQVMGTFGDYAIYSFYPNRQINAAEGGALGCRRAVDAARAVRLRRYGIDLTRFRDALGEIDPTCDVAEVGWAATLNNLCSAIGYAQLPGVSGRIERARAIARVYRRSLRGLQGLHIVEPLPGADPAYWAFLVRVAGRDLVLAHLKGLGIHVSRLHHRTDHYSGFGAPAAELPATQRFFGEVLALPCGWWMSDADVDTVVAAVRQVLGIIPNACA